MESIYLEDAHVVGRGPLQKASHRFTHGRGFLKAMARETGADDDVGVAWMFVDEGVEVWRHGVHARLVQSGCVPVPSGKELTHV